MRTPQKILRFAQDSAEFLLTSPSAVQEWLHIGGSERLDTASKKATEW
jgi:hypothetical protein